MSDEVESLLVRSIRLDVWTSSPAGANALSKTRRQHVNMSYCAQYSEPRLRERLPWRGAGACGEAFHSEWAAGCSAGLGGCRRAATKPSIVSRFT